MIVLVDPFGILALAEPWVVRVLGPELERSGWRGYGVIPA